MSRVLARAVVLLVFVAACSTGSNPSTNQSFSGTTIRVVTFTGPQIAEPLQRRAPDFEKATGAKVQIITVPFSDLYQKLLTDFATKTNSYDATVFDPQWMGDYVPPGYLEDLTDRVKNDSALQWNDIAPFFRDFSATFKGKVYTIPLDGDFQMVYYRKDLLQKDGLQPPATWAASARSRSTRLNPPCRTRAGPSFCPVRRRSSTGRATSWSTATQPCAPTRPTASTTHRSPPSAAGQARSTKPPRPRSRTP